MAFETAAAVSVRFDTRGVFDSKIDKIAEFLRHGDSKTLVIKDYESRDVVKQFSLIFLGETVKMFYPSIHLSCWLRMQCPFPCP